MCVFAFSSGKCFYVEALMEDFLEVYVRNSKQLIHLVPDRFLTSKQFSPHIHSSIHGIYKSTSDSIFCTCFSTTSRGFSFRQPPRRGYRHISRKRIEKDFLAFNTKTHRADTLNCLDTHSYNSRVKGNMGLIRENHDTLLFIDRKLNSC
jgi:hypothetical protein